MKQSLGLIEVKGLSAAIYIADTMVKTANVKLLSLEKTRGIGWIVIKVLGNVGAVNAAINSGKQISVEKGEYVTSKVIPRPTNFIEDFFCREKSEPKEEINNNENKEFVQLKEQKDTKDEKPKQITKNKNIGNKTIKNKEETKK